MSFVVPASKDSPATGFRWGYCESWNFSIPWTWNEICFRSARCRVLAVTRFNCTIYVYVYIYIYMCVCICIHIYFSIYIHISICTYLQIASCQMHAHVFDTHTQGRRCICIYIHIHIYIYIIYIYISADRIMSNACACIWHAYIGKEIHVYMCIYKYVHIHISIYMCLQIASRQIHARVFDTHT